MIRVDEGCLLPLMFIHALLSHCGCCYLKPCCANRCTTNPNRLHAGYGGEHSLVRCPPPQVAWSQTIFLQVDFCPPLQWGTSESSWFVEGGRTGRRSMCFFYPWIARCVEDFWRFLPHLYFLTYIKQIALDWHHSNICLATHHVS